MRLVFSDVLEKKKILTIYVKNLYLFMKGLTELPCLVEASSVDHML